MQVQDGAVKTSSIPFFFRCRFGRRLDYYRCGVYKEVRATMRH